MKYSKYISSISVTGNLLILNYLFIFRFCYTNGFDGRCTSFAAIAFFVFINIGWAVLSAIFKLNKVDRQSHKKRILANYSMVIVFFFFMFLLFFQFVSFNYYSRDYIKILFPLFYIALLLWQFFLYFSIIAYRKYGYNYRNVIIVGYNDNATSLKDYFVNNPWTGYHFKGFITFQKSEKKYVVGTYDELESFIADNQIDEIYIMSNEIHQSIYKIISSIISKHSVKIRLVPDLLHFSNMNISLVNYDLIPIMRIEKGPLNRWHNRFVKRVFDVMFSLIIIVGLLSWLIPLLAIFDLFSGRDGVFFIQKRTGLDNNTFNVIKFRTMVKNSMADTDQVTKDDKRVSKLGGFLRKTSIDELPQFFNVLIGNMSVVGPRPHMLKHTEEYKALVAKFMIRHAVKPGITGYAQVRGARGEIKKAKDIKARIKLDIFYIENWSLTMDIKIVLITIGKIIKGDDKAY